MSKYMFQGSLLSPGNICKYSRRNTQAEALKFRERTGEDGAMINRDGTTQCVAARAGKVHHIADAFTEAIELASTLGTANLVMESDTQVLVYAMNRGTSDASQVPVVIEEAKRLTYMNFQVLYHFLL
ncbi:hypothetical protein ACP70R_032228 [Stipagrostis hirtigluma subsp. patula]